MTLAEINAPGETLQHEKVVAQAHAAIASRVKHAVLRWDGAWSRLLSRADAALYRAKQAGRNQVVADTGS